MPKKTLIKQKDGTFKVEKQPLKSEVEQRKQSTSAAKANQPTKAKSAKQASKE